jgi:hypothetical protein
MLAFSPGCLLPSLLSTSTLSFIKSENGIEFLSGFVCRPSLEVSRIVTPVESIPLLDRAKEAPPRLPETLSQIQELATGGERKAYME